MKDFKRLFVTGGLGAVLAAGALTGCQSSMWGHRNEERASGQVVDDGRITSQVKQELAQEPVFKFGDVDVKTFNGVVQLSGFVNADQQKTRAGELAQQVPGVAQVVNSLTLKSAQPTPTGRPNQAPIETNAFPSNPAPVRR
jgi:osmotically-inducible protein OsmY